MNFDPETCKVVVYATRQHGDKGTITVLQIDQEEPIGGSERELSNFQTCHEHGSLELYLKNFAREPTSDKRPLVVAGTMDFFDNKNNKAVAVYGIFTVVKTSGKSRSFCKRLGAVSATAKNPEKLRCWL